MESSDSFFVTLNDISSSFEFSFFLPEPVDLYADWEVGLQQIILNGNYFSSLSPSTRKVYIRKKDSQDPFNIVRIKSNGIDNLQSFVQTLQLAFDSSEFKDIVDFIFDQQTGYLSVAIDDEYEIRFSDYIADVLNLSDRQIYTGRFYTAIPGQTFFPPPVFYLKSELIDGSILSSEKVQNLRTIVFNNNWKTEGLQMVYNPIEYHKLKVKEAHEIRLSLQQFSGTAISTTFNVATFVLHFRKIKN